MVLQKDIDKLGRDWTDISSEDYREYIFDSKNIIHIEKPLFLHVSESGGHRVFDSSGNSYYVRPGWLAIKWVGNPAFVK